MSAETKAVPGTPLAQRGSETVIPWWRLMQWSLRRELWESRSIYIAPVTVALLAFAGFLVSLLQLPAKIRASAGGSAMQLHDAIQGPFQTVAGLMMAATTLVAVVYSLDALYGERRDRSILFWKSLPVSDLTAVLAKASVPILVLPLLGFVLTAALHLLMALLSSGVLAASGVSVAAFWEQLSFGHMSLLLLYHFLAVHGLSWAPIFGWMLLVSAWARRAPFIWALLPPVAIAVVEKIAFNTSFFGATLGAWVSGSRSVTTSAPGGMMIDPMTTHVTAGRFVAAPDFWIGLALTAVFLAAAVRLRRYQVPGT